MRISKTALGLGVGFACAWGLVACGEGDDPSSTTPGAGTGGASLAGATSHAGTGGAAKAGGGGAVSVGGGLVGEAGIVEEAGATSGGSANGGGGTGGIAGAGTAGAATAGMGAGGAPVVPLTVVIDSWIIRVKGAGGSGGSGGTGGGAGGGAGVSGGGTGGGGSGGTAGTSGGGAGVSGGGTSAGGTSGGGSGGTAGATAGSAGTGGAGILPGTPRSYTFDANTMPWVLNPYGSTPAIGNAGGAEKLSALSALSFNTVEGQPTPGSAQIVAPFSMGSEQLDINQGVSPEENWTGFEIVAKIKVLTAGTIPSACMGAWLYTTSDGYLFGRGPEVFIKPANGWVDLKFDLDAPAAIGEDRGTLPAFDKTTINQVGMQLETWRCP